MTVNDIIFSNVSGVIHVGAHTGQERELYDAHNLNVVWIEPIPELLPLLSRNIKEFKNQHVIKALITDVDGKKYQFHISSHKGVASSILKLKQNRNIWPNVKCIHTVPLRSITLTSLLKKEQIDISKYQALVIDTQGTELLVLQGSIPILDAFEFIKVEVADFEYYEGCCQLSDINKFMTDHNYIELSRNAFAVQENGGSYYDVVYKKLSDD